MAMKHCKECGTEVSSGAKSCPKCGKDQRNFFKKHPVLSIILILILLCIIGSASSNNNSTPTVTNSSNVEEEKVFNIGDSISYDEYEITIKSVTEASKVGTTYLNSQPSEGGVYVCVDLSLKNISSEPMSSWDYPTIYLVDSNGTKYSYDISASSYYATEKDPDKKVLSDLNPGITTTDNNVYEVSKEAYSHGEWFLLIDNKMKVKIK